MSRRYTDFGHGVRDVIPVLPGFVPFSAIVGVAAVNVGIPPAEAIAMNLAIYAGTAELAMIELVSDGVSATVVVVTALLINLRLMMLSAFIAPHLQQLSRRWKWPLGYLLTTPSYVLSTAQFDEYPATNKPWYYLGVSLPMWVVWQTSFAVGATLGTFTPPSMQLDFTLPLVFIALLFKTTGTRGTGTAAATGAVVAVAAAGWPFNSGFMAAVAVGIGAGLLVWRWGR